jgi:hypothetical protein
VCRLHLCASNPVPAKRYVSSYICATCRAVERLLGHAVPANLYIYVLTTLIRICVRECVLMPLYAAAWACSSCCKLLGLPHTRRRYIPLSINVASYHYIRVLAAGLFVGYVGIQYRQTSWTAAYFATLQASSLSLLALLAQKVQILTPEALQLFSEKSKAVIPKDWVMCQNLAVVCVCVYVCVRACVPACVCSIFPRNFQDFFQAL